MPNVGGKKFPYTPKGKADAKAAAARSNQMAKAWKGKTKK